MKLKTLLMMAIIAISSAVFVSCKSDDKDDKNSIPSEYLKVAKQDLNDCVVLNAVAEMGGTNLTKVEGGFPLKHYFTWQGDDVVKVELKGLKFNNMPFSIWFAVDAKLSKLNSWEKKEMPEDGWIKFEGKDGLISFNAISSQFKGGKGNGATVIGYYNVNSKDIELTIDFNVRGVTSKVARQKLDKTRLSHFDEDMAKYIKALQKLKAETGNK